MWTLENRENQLKNKSDANGKVVTLDGESLSLEEVEWVADGQATVALNLGPRFYASRKQIENRMEGEAAVYGVNTGFGNLATVRIPHDKLAILQRNLLISHATGVGAPLPRRVVRSMLLLRANSLAKGYSGVRAELVQLLVDMLNHGVHPVVPSQGSVGASGDLAPLAHIACVLIGEGRAEYNGEVLPAKEALSLAGLNPVQLAPKEGLALINGTQMMASLGALALARALRLVEVAEIAGALSLEAFKGTDAAFHPAIQAVRPHPGQVAAAAHLRELLAGSEVMESHRGCSKVQDPYSLRCMPQVFGAIRDALDYCRRVIEVELNSATDNPLCFPEEDLVLSGGNFHGQPLAIMLDTMGLALVQLGNFSERRSYKLLTSYEAGLPAFLTAYPGLNSGLMVTQYIAAALANDNKVLSHPASADSIPTSAGTEDFNSMGANSALKLNSILENTTRIIAVELMCAAQGVEFHLPLQPGEPLREIMVSLRAVVPHLEEDRLLDGEIEKIAQWILDYGL
ncbi:MAG TPA: histidine ammonia-lyase [Chloroflexia bacterium]|nr:histidine ammonia-lyase [Chloroflexia bacterium]